MATRCLFGIFVFGSNSALVYRFLTDDLFAYLHRRFIDRGYKFDEDLNENADVALSVDDAISQHLAILINFYANTLYRKNSIKRISLELGVHIFFDQIGENNVICMADDSFNTLVVLKTINLLKSLIKFHMGALPFSSTEGPVKKLIDRLSASIQYYLNNVTTNQALLFESCEYLHINSLIRQQCAQACATINHDVQFSLHVPPTAMLITCKDKIVHLHLSSDQNRPSNSDIFLLLLNNTSRSLRKQFKSEPKTSSNIMAHIYKTKINDHTSHNLTNSEKDSPDDTPLSHERRAHSLPTIPGIETIHVNDNRRIEVVFMKTPNRILAPFTLYTIPLTDEISVLTLVEWKSSLACSNLSELLRRLDLYINQFLSSYNELNNLIKSVENNGPIRQYFASERHSTSILSNALNKIQSLHKSLSKITDRDSNENVQIENRIRKNLTDMRRLSISVFHHIFFESEEYALVTNDDEQQSDILLESTNHASLQMIQTLRSKLLMQLGDWFSFIEIKSQRNITMSFCHIDFPGLVHFVLIDRSRGRICTPALFTDDYQFHTTTNHNTNGLEQLLENKILAFELECLSALQRGCTSYKMTDEHFTYNYTLRLQENNGASMRLYKPFVKSEPPGILHFDFYHALAYENYSSLNDQTTIACYELICVHLRIVPSSNVREQCEKLWPRLMELDE